VSIEELLDIQPAHAIIDPAGTRKQILAEFDAAASDPTRTSEQRGSILAFFKATFDIVEANVAKEKPDLLEEFQKARALDYRICIVRECTVGLDTPVVGGDVSVEMLKAVTDREIADGRMDEGHTLRKLALDGCAAPHLSHQELVAKHAGLKAQAQLTATAPPPIGKFAGLKRLFSRKA
jgi:hypothetical protein